KSDTLRAVMEGLYFSLKDCNDILIEMGTKVDAMMACGGGGKSPIWRQMLADMYDCDVMTVTATEGPALCVAILAGVGAGIYSSVEDACDKMIHTDKKCSPIADNTAKYNEYHKIYKDLYTSLNAQYKALAAID
ncbi:MAG: xylulokinase, partial [Lachnospiraceae bacterium]|nr:xylulokinase [Lachnospiraceae bacterium]